MRFEGAKPVTVPVPHCCDVALKDGDTAQWRQSELHWYLGQGEGVSKTCKKIKFVVDFFGLDDMAF